MRKTKRRKKRANVLGVIATIVILIGFAFAIMPYALRLFYYRNSAELARQMEDKLGENDPIYVKVDYSKLNTADPCVYTPEEIDAAQQNPDLLDDIAGLAGSSALSDLDASDSATTIDSDKINEDTYLLEIPAINLKICAIRCSSFTRIYKCMRLGAAIFPDAPEPDEIGNICMSAHRTGSKDYFRNLDDLSIGNIVYLHCAKNVSYQYKVVSVSTIEPDDWSVTGQTLNPTLTMLSCQEYQGVSNGRRIMVRAELAGVSN
jgi:LPXTG-site transpeptidase (sortase) family protein